MPKPKLPYAQGFRDQMVELVRSGRTPSDLAKAFGCHVTSILSWVRAAGGGGAGAATLPANVAALNAQERQKLIELRRKLRLVQMEDVYPVYELVKANQAKLLIRTQCKTL